MTEYTIEELERMLNDARERESIPQKSEQELQSLALDEALDAEKEFFYSNDYYGSLIMTIRSSVSLNLKEITRYVYIEEMENDQVICRCMNSGYVEMLTYNEPNPIPKLIINGSRQINRMDGVE